MDTKLIQYTKWIESKTQHHDASHDIVHIKNVVSLAQTIMDSMHDTIDEQTRELVLFTALSHELCDKKYVKEPQTNLE